MAKGDAAVQNIHLTSAPKVNLGKNHCKLSTVLQSVAISGPVGSNLKKVSMMLLRNSSVLSGKQIVCEDVSPVDLRFSASRNVRFAKRVLDFSLVALSVPVVLAILAVAAIAIKSTSKGSVFFAQQRYGLGRVPFRVYKLRTMTVMEDGDAFRQVTAGDARITPVGRFLRKSSIDELPQLFNVLRGEMSLVGPRPHAIKMDDDFSRKIEGYDRRFDTLPGLTGLAQVRGHRGETNTLNKMKMRIDSDVEYVEKQSIWLDLVILFRTLLVVLSQRNAF